MSVVRDYFAIAVASMNPVSAVRRDGTDGAPNDIMWTTVSARVLYPIAGWLPS